MTLLPLTQQLLTWFDDQKRDLPWRDAPCGERNPYRVWLSEIMLQQTQVVTVIPYFHDFLTRWPTVKDLAAAKDDDVMRAWAGLGYYARARNLLKCARVVAGQYQGAFPRAAIDLITLPGIGPYTADAIAAIAFGQATAPVDGNVIRTLSRLYAIDAQMPKHKDKVAERAKHLSPALRSGDFVEALMDLGSGVCRPKNPNCEACPWAQACQASAQGQATAYPKKAPKKPKPTRKGWVFWIERPDGQVALERRPKKGLLGGMMGFPTTHWGPDLISVEDAVKDYNVQTWSVSPQVVLHTFTHFHLQLSIVRIKVKTQTAVPGTWFARDQIKDQALPSLMVKVLSSNA